MADWITGRQIVAAAKKASAWRTALACGAGDGILITRESLGAKAPKYVDDNSLGQAEISRSVMTGESIANGSLDGILRFEGWDLLLALTMGVSNYAAGANSKEHLYTTKDTLAGLFATLAVKKTGTTHDVWEVPSAKLTGFTIRGRVGELCNISFRFSGNKIETESTINTTATMATVTYPLAASADGQVKMDTSTSLQMNAFGGAALGAGDKIYPIEFELSYDRPFNESFEAGYLDGSEPAQNDFSKGAIKLSFDKYGLDDFVDAVTAEANQKMKIVFEGGIIAGADTYKLEAYLPCVSFQSVLADVGGPGPIPMSIEGKLLAPSAAPTGFTAILGSADADTSLNIYTRNSAVDPLA